MAVAVMLLVFALVAVACGGTDDAAISTTEDGTADGTADSAADEGTPTIRYDLQGHRGARGLRPENTLPSFETALDLGVTTLELDTHLSADGVVVVWHDPVIDPAKCRVDPSATNPPPDPDDPATDTAALMIANLTASELASYRCDRNPDAERFPDQAAEAGALTGDAFEIATLADVFATAEAYAGSDAKTPEQRANAADVEFNIETKRVPDQPENIGDDFDGVNPGPFEIALLAAIGAAGVEERVVIQSFDHRSLWAVHSVNQAVALAALTSRGDIPDFADLAARGATIWSPDRRSVSADTLASAREAGLAVIPWTINDTDEMRDLLSLGVDGIITDRPDLAPPP